MVIITIRNSVVLAILLLLSTSSGYAAEKIKIVERGRALATIVVDGKSSAKLKTAAEALSYYLQRSTGATFSISDKPAARTNTPIQIQLVVKSSGNASEITRSDQYTIDFPDKTTIIIEGESDWGTEFGVCDFLVSVN
jgi:hypothetical protein